MKSSEYLQKLFARNPETGGYVIEILLEKYRYVFNEWDSSYFQRRELDPDLIQYLESCATEIPRKHRLELLFTVSENQDPDKERLLSSSMRNAFRFNIVLQKKLLARIYRRALMYVILSCGFLLSAVLLEPRADEMVYIRAALEGLFIGGWVFLWEAISQISFNRATHADRIREYKRMLQADFRFVYHQNPLSLEVQAPANSGARKKDAIDQAP
ncbi:hypothetical protein [Spirochaeta africana]|uniref:Uncharacterized protein n=1 Tax=Spirochaeta africana (strain ATCC 700263 / DSM 8902 / Z-7692) TaxID=889378 RepID=H9UMH8_SPIAZ|nr:hypothetical protein [Spirochaeta africana]AFG38721.1 hypothetical protein Spiaf_2696 [Spirochaeta africana DSM 8902]